MVENATPKKHAHSAVMVMNGGRRIFIRLVVLNLAGRRIHFVIGKLHVTRDAVILLAVL